MINTYDNNPERKKSKIKIQRILNFIYCILAGLVGGFASKKFTKYYKIVGVIIIVLFYIINKMLLTEEET
jgi:hypothetical protein